jgi:hypothetical protein
MTISMPYVTLENTMGFPVDVLVLMGPAATTYDYLGTLSSQQVAPTSSNATLSIADVYWLRFRIPATGSGTPFNGLPYRISNDGVFVPNSTRTRDVQFLITDDTVDTNNARFPVYGSPYGTLVSPSPSKYDTLNTSVIHLTMPTARVENDISDVNIQLNNVYLSPTASITVTILSGTNSACAAPYFCPNVQGGSSIGALFLQDSVTLNPAIAPPNLENKSSYTVTTGVNVFNVPLQDVNPFDIGGSPVTTFTIGDSKCTYVFQAGNPYLIPSTTACSTIGDYYRYSVITSGPSPAMYSGVNVADSSGTWACDVACNSPDSIGGAFPTEGRAADGLPALIRSVKGICACMVTATAKTKPYVYGSYTPQYAWALKITEPLAVTSKQYVCNSMGSPVSITTNAGSIFTLPSNTSSTASNDAFFPVGISPYPPFATLAYFGNCTYTLPVPAPTLSNGASYTTIPLSSSAQKNTLNNDNKDYFTYLLYMPNSSDNVAYTFYSVPAVPTGVCTVTLALSPLMAVLVTALNPYDPNPYSSTTTPFMDSSNNAQTTISTEMVTAAAAASNSGATAVYQTFFTNISTNVFTVENLYAAAAYISAAVSPLATTMYFQLYDVDTLNGASVYTLIPNATFTTTYGAAPTVPPKAIVLPGNVSVALTSTADYMNFTLESSTAIPKTFDSATTVALYNALTCPVMYSTNDGQANEFASTCILPGTFAYFSKSIVTTNIYVQSVDGAFQLVLPLNNPKAGTNSVQLDTLQEDVTLTFTTTNPPIFIINAPTPYGTARRTSQMAPGAVGVLLINCNEFPVAVQGTNTVLAANTARTQGTAQFFPPPNYASSTMMYMDPAATLTIGNTSTGSSGSLPAVISVTVAELTSATAMLPSGLTRAFGSSSTTLTSHPTVTVYVKNVATYVTFHSAICASTGGNLHISTSSGDAVDVVFGATSQTACIPVYTDTVSVTFAYSFGTTKNSMVMTAAALLNTQTQSDVMTINSFTPGSKATNSSGYTYDVPSQAVVTLKCVYPIEFVLFPNACGGENGTVPTTATVALGKTFNGLLRDGAATATTIVFDTSTVATITVSGATTATWTGTVNDFLTAQVLHANYVARSTFLHMYDNPPALTVGIVCDARPFPVLPGGKPSNAVTAAASKKHNTTNIPIIVGGIVAVLVLSVVIFFSVRKWRTNKI